MAEKKGSIKKLTKEPKEPKEVKEGSRRSGPSSDVGEPEHNEVEFSFSKQAAAVILVFATIVLAILYYSETVFKDDVTYLVESVEADLAQMDAEFAHNHSKDIEDKEYVKSLLRLLSKRDQHVREKLVTEVLSGGSRLGTQFDQHRGRLKEAIGEFDKRNVIDLKEILKKYGWVKISEFGEEADSNAWLIVQHADFDEGLQYKSLFFMEQFKAIGETSRENYALLYDRLTSRYHEFGLKQKFGTQGKIVESRFELFPYEGTLEEVNARRMEYGLGSVYEFLDAANSSLNDIKSQERQ